MTTRRFGFVTTICFAMLVVLPWGAPAAAQSQPPAKDAVKRVELPTVPVRVIVTLGRFQGEKKISSLPFSLIVRAVDRQTAGSSPVSMRMGIDVPIGTTTTTENRTTPAGTGATRSTESTNTNVQYRSVGTNIDCWVIRLDETNFQVEVRLSDSSIYSPEGDTAKGLRATDFTAFRTFTANNTMVLRDGQTVLFGAGTDKISGETLKVDVSIHVEK